MRAVVKIICLVLVAFCVSPAAAAERERDKGKDDPPTELWEAFPLSPEPAESKPSPVATQAPPKQPVSAPSTERPATADGAEDGGLRTWFLVTLIAAAGAALALALVLRQAHTALLRGAVSMRGHERSRGPAPALTRVATYHARPDHTGDQTPEDRGPSHDVGGQIEAAKAIERRLHEAASPSPATGELHPVPRIAEPKPIGLERCSISVWQGFERSRFVAMPVDGGRREKVAESPVFRIAGVHAPERTATAETALAEILGELERRGWSVVGQGPEWFDRLLERPAAERAS